MARDARLKLLTAAFDFTSPPPKGRSVTMAARVLFCDAMSADARDIQAQDPGARVPGGRAHGPVAQNPKLLEIATWNTGKPSDLREYGTRTHAENQFYEFMRGKKFDHVDIELSHSPCTGCCDLLAGLLRGSKATGTLCWARPYEWGIQATTSFALMELLKAGWKLAAPADAIPGGATGLPIRRL